MLKCDLKAILTYVAHADYLWLIDPLVSNF